jgi:hypothetical protein
MAVTSKAASSPRANVADGYEHAMRIIRGVCCLAGSVTFLDELRRDLRWSGVVRAIERHDTPRLFDWLVQSLSFQGVSDAVARGYMERHGRITWAEIDAGLAACPSCPKLISYWHFWGCRYHKSSGTCAEPDHLPGCPLPGHPLRNGRLNQLAYSLFLFIRDAAGGDLVSWLDTRLAAAGDQAEPDRLGRMRQAVLGPLRHVYGVSDKVLSMALSDLLLASGHPRWVGVGGSMVAVDSLVHNFLHRTGILRRLEAGHPFGPRCYRPGGCADIVRQVSSGIDARQFNGRFPANFPRFVQHAIWRYCTETELGVCNGNAIDDRYSCTNVYCRAFRACDRVALRTGLAK